MIERVPNKVKFEARMIDDRIIQAQKFMKDDDLIDYENFKYFLFKIKLNEMSLELQPRDSEEKVVELV